MSDRPRHLFKLYYKRLLRFQGLPFHVRQKELAPSLPIECVGLTCGAKTKAGSSCKETKLLAGGRCRNHGGLSTGPRTLQGKHASALNTGKTYEQLVLMRT